MRAQSDRTDVVARWLHARPYFRARYIFCVSSLLFILFVVVVLPKYVIEKIN
jgi:hypothetical protein